MQLQSRTIAGHLSAVKGFQQVTHGFELVIRHQWVVDALKGGTLSRAGVDTPVSACVDPWRDVLCVWDSRVITNGVSVGRWGARAVVGPWGIRLYLLAQGGETFAGNWRDGHCFRQKGVAFLHGSTQMDWTLRSNAIFAKVRFRNSKKDIFFQRQHFFRERSPSLHPAGGGRRSNNVFCVCSSFLPADAPLKAFDTGGVGRGGRNCRRQPLSAKWWR